MTTATTIFDRLDDPSDHLYGLDDPQRIRVLASIDFDNAALHADLDAIAARTADRLAMPISLVTLLLDTAQVFAGSHGIGAAVAAAGTPAEWSLCAHAVATRQPYVVEDVANDPVQRANPATAVGIASYAGVPLVLDGQALGAHCVMGTAARAFTDTDLDELRAGADESIAVIQRYRIPLG